MNPEVKEKWVGALRSGEFPQTTGRLETSPERASLTGDNEGFCCLGVLSNIAANDGNTAVKRFTQSTSLTYYGTDEEANNGGFGASFPPSSVLTWAGLNSENPEVEVTAEFLSRYATTGNQCGYNLDDPSRVYAVPLSELNDDFKVPFPVIADLIEEQL